MAYPPSSPPSPTWMALSSCVFCGTPCSSDECRYTSAGSAQELVRARCYRTSFHYAAIMDMPPEQRRATCLACVNWKRRARQGRNCLPRRRAYTPFDSILLYALTPHHAPEPDRRCLPRLVRTVLDPSNAFAALVPVHALTILQSIIATPMEKSQLTLLRTWWDVNERTRFFRHTRTARAVRLLAKSTPLSSESSI